MNRPKLILFFLGLGAVSVAATQQSSHEQTASRLAKLTYLESGKPLFAPEDQAAEWVKVHGLRRWRATASAIVLDRLQTGDTEGVPITGTLTLDQTRFQGASADGRLRLFAPEEVDQGSSLAHWDFVAMPDLLMEPGITPGLAARDLDITPQLMFDLGWQPGTSTFNLISNDEAGVGFNDARAFAGAPGNNALTVGEARRNVFEAALAVWGAVLDSPVPIDVIVSYADLTCDDDGVALAGATSLFQFVDDDGSSGLPRTGLVYPGPLAEALLGEDLSGPPSADGGDISVTVNQAIDADCRGNGAGFYYGLDGNEGPGESDFLPVALHEIGHGLGFQNFANLQTGRPRSGTPSVYDLFTVDLSTGKNWAEMTFEERQNSAINNGNVVWNGASVTARVDQFLGPVDILRVAGDETVSGDYDLAYGSIGAGPPATDSSGPLGCILDPAGDVFDGCEEAVSDLTDQIALVRRGSCFFVTKAVNAEAAGARGLVIVNNAGESGVPPGGDLSIPINIPVAGMGQSDGEALIAASCNTDSPIRRATPMLDVDAARACPGFYIGRVDALTGDGRWNMTIGLSAGRRLLQGGLNLGGGFEDESRPGFAAFNIANANNEPQVVAADLSVQKAAGMAYQFDIVRREGELRTIVATGESSAENIQFTEVLEPGFYSIRVFAVAGTGVAPATFNLALQTRFVDRAGGAFQGGVNLGGIMRGGTEFGTESGFAALCISTAQTVTFETLDAPGAVPSLGLSVLDRDRNVIESVP